MSAESTASGRGARDLALLIPTALVPKREDLPGFSQVHEYVRASKAENTLRGCKSDWRNFCAWCESRGPICSLPAAANTVAAYIAECAGRLKPGSIQRRLNAIAEAHKAASLESPYETR